MARERRALSSANLYHIMARGVGRGIIFEDDADRRAFLNLLGNLATHGKAALHAWCLMDNHYHLLVEGDMEHISQAMRLLNSSYALYFNERHGRVGHVFQGRFKSEPIESDAYYLTVLRYIHQNPVAAGIAAIDAYRWSSYREYLDEPGLCSTSLALSMFDGVDEFEAFHMTLDKTAACVDVNGGRRSLDAERTLEVARAALGDVRPEEVVGLDRKDRDQALRALKDTRLSLRQIERVTGISKSVIALA